MGTAITLSSQTGSPSGLLWTIYKSHYVLISIQKPNIPGLDVKQLVELEALGALVRLARLLDDRSAAAARHARGQGKDGFEVVSRGQLGLALCRGDGGDQICVFRGQ